MSGPGGTYSLGNIDREWILSINIAAGTVATNTATIVTVSVPGLLVGDFCSVSPQENLWPASQPAINLTADAAWASAAGVLSVAFSNITGAASTQTTAVQYVLNVARNAAFSNGLVSSLPPSLNP